LTPHPEREILISLINEAKQNGARLGIACDTAGITLRSYRRWFKNNEVMTDQRCEVERPTPKNKLSEHEVQQILNVSNEPKGAHIILLSFVTSIRSKLESPPTYSPNQFTNKLNNNND
jgi:hypothetical protein